MTSQTHENDVLAEGAKRASELFVEIQSGLEERRVDPGVTREELRARLAGTLGEDGIGIPAMLEQFRRELLPACMGTPHPLYLGLINSSPLPAAPLADLLVSALNNNGGAFHQSPAFSTLEDEVLRTLGRALGLGDGLSGMFLPGGSYATLQALLLARARHFPGWESDGPTAVTAAPVIYSSDSSHFSVARSAKAIGIGARGVVPVPSRGRGELDTAALARRVAEDRTAGRAPFAVVATAGTTGTGAIDPIAEVADLCERERLWLHVDACYGGAALLLDELRPRFAGIERADSISIDPHKWFFIPMTAGILYTRHPELEVATFDTASASYIPGDGKPDPFRRGFPTSRRSSGATAWMALRAHGLGAVRAHVRRNVALTRLLERLLAERGFRVLPGGELSIACARFEPGGRAATELDALQAGIARSVVATGKAWFSTVRHAGETWLRFNMVNIHTREEHVRDLVSELDRARAEPRPLA